jgi:hypothetical protein
MRLARGLLDGVRQGQPLAALLGYRLERRLHDGGLDRYIDTFRAAAPLAPSPTVPTGPTESIAPTNVVHGLTILGLWQRNEAPFLSLRTSATFADFLKIDAAFRQLEDSVDAVGDLLVAESVFQATRGAFDRASATLDSVARGETLSVPEVLDTPRTGIGLTHRLVALFGAPVSVSGWSAQPRGAAEPWLNGWVSQLLGGPVRVRCRATYIDPSTGQPVPGRSSVREVRLSDLRLSALDVVYLAAARGQSELGELEQRLRYFFKRTPPAGSPPDVEVRLDYSRAPTWAASIVSFDEFLESARAVGRLVASARAAGADDLALPEDAPPSGVDVAELRRRATNAETALRLVQRDLRALLNSATPPDLEALRAVLLRATHFGLYSAVPVSAFGDTPADRAALLDQAGSIDGDLAARLAGLDAVPAASADPASQVEREVERLRVIFGRNFLVLPRFRSANPDALGQAFGASVALQGGDPTEAFTWLARAARVREGAGRLLDALRYAEALESSAAALTIGQLPFAAGDRWVTLPPEPGKAMPPGRVSLVTCGALPADLRQPISGVVIDEWNEVVPSARETTGLVFHFDEPDARAPQAVLLAVAPDATRPWDLETLEAVLLETLELAQLRLVDPDALLELDHYLPGLYFALNAANEAVATRFQ